MKCDTKDEFNVRLSAVPWKISPAPLALHYFGDVSGARQQSQPPPERELVIGELDPEA